MATRNLVTKYEVQFLDGLGNWRRWSLNSTPERAEASLKRLEEAHGLPYLTRIKPQQFPAKEA